MFVEAVVRVGKARLVDDEPRVHLTRRYSGHDLVVAKFMDFNIVRLRKLEQQVGGGEAAGDGDAFTREVR